MIPPHLVLGKKGEDLALAFLEAKGFVLVTRNWRWKHWEIDLLCHHLNCLHVIEVKTRSNISYGYPEQFLQRTQLNRLKKAAAIYQYQHPQWKEICFHVVAIVVQKGVVKDLQWFKDIF
jgi:putative endonuclease